MLAEPPLRRWKILKPKFVTLKKTRWELYCVVAARSEEEARLIAKNQTTAGKNIHVSLESHEETAAIAANLSFRWNPNKP